MHEYYRKSIPRNRYIDLIGLITNPVGTLLGPTGLGVTGGGSAVGPGGILGPGSEMAAYASAQMAKETQRETNEFNAGEAQKAREFSATEATTAREYNSLEAQKNRDFQAQQVLDAQKYNTMMSNSAYQRATADMKQAGINPMLAFTQGGASSPQSAVAGGGSASASAPGSAVARGQQAKTAEMFQKGIMHAISSSMEAKRLDKEMEVRDSEIDVNKANKLYVDANTARSLSEKNNLDARTTGERLSNIYKEIENSILNRELIFGKFLGKYIPGPWQNKWKNNPNMPLTDRQKAIEKNSPHLKFRPEDN